MEGTKPKVTVEPGASPQVQQGVNAVNGLVTEIVGAIADLAQLPAQAKALIAEAKALPAQVPNAVKSAGLGGSDVLKVGRAVKDNIKVVTSLPTEAAKLVKAGQSTLSTIASTFA